MKHYGKSYKQWFREVERMIHKRGFSIEYANAQVVCVRSLYTNNHNFKAPEYAAEYALRNVKRYINEKSSPQRYTACGSERNKKWQQNVTCAVR